MRLNDEIDADAHALLSDAEHYLWDPPVPPLKAPSSRRATKPSTAANLSSSAADKASSGWSGNIQGENRRGGSVVISAPRTRGKERAKELEQANNGKHITMATGGDRKASSIHRKLSRTDSNVTAGGVRRKATDVQKQVGDTGSVAITNRHKAGDTPASGASPLFRLSERVKEAARASGGRNRGIFTGATSPRLSDGVTVSSIGMLVSANHFLERALSRYNIKLLEESATPWRFM